jgi:hypothetical protein
MQEYKNLLFSLSAMSAFRTLLQEKAVNSLVALLSGGQSPYEDAACYGRVLQALQGKEMTLSDYLYSCILYSKSAFSSPAAQGVPLSLSMRAAARHDLRALGQLGHIPAAALKSLMVKRHPDWETAIGMLPEYRTGHERYALENGDWSRESEDLYHFYRENGCGPSARLRAAGLEDVLKDLALSPSLHTF